MDILQFIITFIIQIRNYFFEFREASPAKTPAVRWYEKKKQFLLLIFSPIPPGRVFTKYNSFPWHMEVSCILPLLSLLLPSAAPTTGKPWWLSGIMLVEHAEGLLSL